MNRTFILYGFAYLAVLSGCQTTDQMNAQDMANDKQHCQSLGFAEGSQALADCMDTAAATRSAQRDRQAAWQAQSNADYQAWRRKVDNNYSPPSYMNSGSMGASTLPSAAGISGMKCSGSGNSASCDALSSDGSDGQ